MHSVRYSDRGGSSDRDRVPARLRTTANIAGNIHRVARVAPTSPPTTARPSGADCSAALPRPKAIGNMPAIIARLVMRMGRKRLLRTIDGGVDRAAPPDATPFGERDEQNGVGNSNADRHDRADERLHVERRAGDP